MGPFFPCAPHIKTLQHKSPIVFTTGVICQATCVSALNFFVGRRRRRRSACVYANTQGVALIHTHTEAAEKHAARCL
jgi:hypothetical protein